MRRSASSGVTLIELMVTVAIIGVLASAAAVAVRERPTPVAARHVQVLLGEARRLAISGGPIRPDVRAATGIRERARIEISQGATGFYQVELLRLREDPLAAAGDWVIEETYTLHDDARISGVAAVLQTEPDGAAPAGLAGVEIRRFFPDGTSDAATVFLCDDRRDDGQDDPFRVTLSPLTASTAVLKGW